MKLGTYSTFDCPCKSGEPFATSDLIDKAYEWLKVEFEKIGGKVRTIINPHDFGSYPSFEIDYPEDLEEHGGDDCTICEVGEPCPLDEWHNKANDIGKEYNLKFNKYL